MSFQSKIRTARQSRSAEHPVAGSVLRFYPNRMALLEEVRDLSGPLLKAVASLYQDHRSDSQTTTESYSDADGGKVDKIHVSAISEAAALRHKAERDEAIDTILTIADGRNRILLGKLFMDSLRDEFSYNPDRPIGEIERFLYGNDPENPEYEGLDVPVLAEMLQGWIKGNAQVFGEAGKQMVGRVKEKLVDLTASQSMEPTPSTSGDDSKTASAPQSDSDSQPST